MVKKALSLLLAAMLLAAAPTLAYAAEPPGTPEISGYTVSYSENEEDGGSVISVLSGENQAAEPDGGFYPIEIRTEETDGEKLIIKTYQVPANTSVSRLTGEFEKNGIRYEVQEVLKKPLADELETKTVSKTVTAASDSDKEAKLLQLFEPTLAYDEDGYQGQLQLDAGRIITEVSETEPYRYLVTETRQMSGMDRNDTYYIPKTACKNGIQLQLCDVDWTTMGCGEANGRLIPNRFTATAQYSGYATGSRATEYIATATYTGQVQRAVPGDVLYSIVFAPSVDQPLSPLNEPNEWGGTPFFILGAIILVGAAGTGAWFLWKNRDLRPAREKTKIYMPREMEQDGEVRRMYEKLRSFFQTYGLWFFVGLILAGLTIGAIVSHVNGKFEQSDLTTPQYAAQPADPAELTFDLEQNKAYSAEDGVVVIEPAPSAAQLAQTASITHDPETIWEEDQVITYNSFTLPDKVEQEDGSLGVLTIPEIGLSVNVFAAKQGEELEAMTQGLAHFSHTSSWDGNIGICGHNVNFDLSDGYFKNLHQLKKGDKLTYSTSLGERTYEVELFKTIAEDDWSYLGRTGENKITLITCISGQPTKRLVVQAAEVK